jgi:hypothetical protein
MMNPTLIKHKLLFVYMETAWKNKSLLENDENEGTEMKVGNLWE